MELKQIEPENVAQIKFQLAGDLTATVALVLKDGTLEVITGVPVKEAKFFQQLVESQPKEAASEKVHVEVDPHENEPGPPVYQAVCSACGTIHSATGNISCLCAFCGDFKELVHSGACAQCCKQRFGHYFEQLGTPLGTLQEQRPPWAN